MLAHCRTFVGGGVRSCAQSAIPDLPRVSDYNHDRRPGQRGIWAERVRSASDCRLDGKIPRRSLSARSTPGRSFLEGKASSNRSSEEPVARWIPGGTTLSSLVFRRTETLLAVTSGAEPRCGAVLVSSKLGRGSAAVLRASPTPRLKPVGAAGAIGCN